VRPSAGPGPVDPISSSRPASRHCRAMVPPLTPTTLPLGANSLLGRNFDAAVVEFGEAAGTAPSRGSARVGVGGCGVADQYVMRVVPAVGAEQAERRGRCGGEGRGSGAENHGADD